MSSNDLDNLSLSDSSEVAKSKVKTSSPVATSILNPAQNLALGSLNAARGKPPSLTADGNATAPIVEDPAVLARIAMVRIFERTSAMTNRLVCGSEQALWSVDIRSRPVRSICQRSKYDWSSWYVYGWASCKTRQCPSIEDGSRRSWSAPRDHEAADIGAWKSSCI